MSKELIKEILSKIVRELSVKDWIEAVHNETSNNSKKTTRATKEATKNWEEIQKLINEL